MLDGKHVPCLFSMMSQGYREMKALGTMASYLNFPTGFCEHYLTQVGMFGPRSLSYLFPSSLL